MAADGKVAHMHYVDSGKSPVRSLNIYVVVFISVVTFNWVKKFSAIWNAILIDFI